MFADDFIAPSIPVIVPFQRRVYAHGFCVVPLFGVLEILGLKIKYGAEEFVFLDRETGQEQFRSPRNGQYRTPWEILWERKLIGDKEFQTKARKWFMDNPHVPYDHE